MKDQWQPVEDARVRRLLQGQGPPLLEVKVKGRRICLARAGGKVWAVDARCPHQGGPLAAGSINEHCQVVCPWHRFAFDLQSGQSDSGGYFIRSYELRQQGKQLYIKLPRKKFLGLF